MSLLMPALASAGWVPQNSGITQRIYSVCFPANASTGYAAGFGGKILKTLNGGAVWDTLHTGTIQDLFSVHFPVDAANRVCRGGSRHHPQEHERGRGLGHPDLRHNR